MCFNFGGCIIYHQLMALSKLKHLPTYIVVLSRADIYVEASQGANAYCTS